MTGRRGPPTSWTSSTLGSIPTSSRRPSYKPWCPKWVYHYQGYREPLLCPTIAFLGPRVWTSTGCSRTSSRAPVCAMPSKCPPATPLRLTLISATCRGGCRSPWWLIWGRAFPWWRGGARTPLPTLSITVSAAFSLYSLLSGKVYYSECRIKLYECCRVLEMSLTIRQKWGHNFIILLKGLNVLQVIFYFRIC